jgi:hypothetical protein
MTIYYIITLAAWRSQRKKIGQEQKNSLRSAHQVQVQQLPLSKWKH